MNWIYEPWPWYIGGPFIALTLFLLLMVGKNFGMSSNLRTLCTLCGAGNTSEFFKFDWKAQRWNLVVALGVLIGGFIGAHFLSTDTAVAIRFEINSFYGEKIEFKPKEKSVKRYLYGGILFGLGWALAGACPGPMFALLGAGFYSIAIVIAAALLGTFLYGVLKEKLPHS